jgi:tetratricopeptide (TPR) repeat protein
VNEEEPEAGKSTPGRTDRLWGTIGLVMGVVGGICLWQADSIGMLPRAGSIRHPTDLQAARFAGYLVIVLVVLGVASGIVGLVKKERPLLLAVAGVVVSGVCLLVALLYLAGLSAPRDKMARSLDIGRLLTQAYGHMAAGEFEQAADVFTAVIELEPEESANYHFRGEAYLRSGKLDRAISDFTQALAVEPDVAPTHVLRGDAYFRAGELEKAKADYAKAIELDPDSRSAERARAGMKKIAE